MLREYLFWVCIFLSSGLIVNCSATLNPEKFGRDDPSQPNTPELTVSALGLFNDKSEPSVDVEINIDSKSLIYRIQNRKLVARIKVDLQLIDTNEQVVISKKYNAQIKKALTTDMNELGVHKMSKYFDVSSGQYTVRISVTDQNTGEQSVYETTALVPTSNREQPFLTDIQMYILNPESNKYETVNGYDIQAKLDTLKLIVQVAIPEDSEEPLQMSSTLIEFASDTLPARPIGDANYTNSSLPYKGVNYYQENVIQTINRKLTSNGNISVEFKYPALARGNYRFNVRLEESSIGDEVNSKRDFSIKSKHFPVLKSPKEKARPLVYLMESGEYRELMKIQETDSLRKAIDQFWIDHIGSVEEARKVERQYFNRVFIANKEFSGFKEGWKTDQGMVFILFGNPWIIDKDFEEETWYYSYNRLDEEKTFTFRRTKIESDSYPFKNYLLQRKFLYHNVLYQQKRLWLTGQILDTQI